MEAICRLCCSTTLVNNNIFDEENALYLKMSLYLPIKVFKNDRLPQKVCDKCSCKVNDFYQFCNETIEVQDRLRAVLKSSGFDSENLVDLTRIKENTSPVPCSAPVRHEQGTQTEPGPPCGSGTSNEPLHTVLAPPQHVYSNSMVHIKQEPPLSPVKEESMDHYDNGGISDTSDNMSLIQLKKKKKGKKELNGIKKKPQKKKGKLKDWETIMNGLPEGTVLMEDSNLQAVKEEAVEPLQPPHHTPPTHSLKEEPHEGELFHCCVCLLQCYSRTEIIHHYRQHALESRAASAPPPPAPPPPPPAPPPAPPGTLRCTRCRKALAASEWAAHWARHWERDTRPFRCALCERSFRDATQILKHGQTHKYGGAGASAGAETAATPAVNKRFVCDLCPEEFVFMRYLQAHRARAHPEACARALVLRCTLCARQFAHLNSLRRHLRAHSGERNHLCNVCGKALSSREHLKFHIRIHTGYKPHVCSVCGKGFVKKCNLTLHERVHSGEKPHVCSHCGKAFSQRSTLVIHERYHSGARPYVCALCGRGFVARGLLSMHLKTTCV